VADLELAREGNVWRMLPSNRHEVDLLAYYQSTSSESRLYAIQLDQIAEQVLRGTFSNREQALQAVTAACSRDDNGSHAAGYE
jgi:hypothetical protein